VNSQKREIRTRRVSGVDIGSQKNTKKVVGVDPRKSGKQGDQIAGLGGEGNIAGKWRRGLGSRKRYLRGRNERGSSREQSLSKKRGGNSFNKEREIRASRSGKERVLIDCVLKQGKGI